jgi:hypothetical protein
MTDLEQVLFRVGLIQYYERLVAEGFEDWETVLDITEADLYVMTLSLFLSPASSLSRCAIGLT